MSEVRHPIFARFFERLSRLMEREVGEHRRELLAGLSAGWSRSARATA